LVENFVGAEIFPKADGTGGAEEATEGTAGLGGDAERVVNTGFEFVGEADRFDLVMVGSFKEDFVGLVALDFVNFF